MFFKKREKNKENRRHNYTMTKGKLLVFSAPSGSGKTTIVNDIY